MHVGTAQRCQQKYSIPEYNKTFPAGKQLDYWQVDQESDHSKNPFKNQLKSAGVDTNIYTAHSTRGAAASKAAASGETIQAILKQGHWSRESTFARFYQREIEEPANLLENAILGAEMVESSSESGVLLLNHS